MPDVTLAVTFQDGTVLRALGFINIEGWESESNKLTLGLYPHDNKWENFTGTGGDVSGSIKKLVVNGTTYRVLADANATMLPSEYKNEPVPHSGGVLRKMSKQERSILGLAIACTASEREVLRQLAET